MESTNPVTPLNALARENDKLRAQRDELVEALERFKPYADQAEMRWMSVEDATIEVPARAVAKATRVLTTLEKS